MSQTYLGPFYGDPIHVIMYICPSRFMAGQPTSLHMKLMHRYYFELYNNFFLFLGKVDRPINSSLSIYLTISKTSFEIKKYLMFLYIYISICLDRGTMLHHSLTILHGSNSPITCPYINPHHLPTPSTTAPLRLQPHQRNIPQPSAFTSEIQPSKQPPCFTHMIQLLHYIT